MDEVIEKIRVLLAGVPAGEYKGIHYGANHLPAQSALPCIEVVPVRTEVSNMGTRSNKNEFVVRVAIKDTLKNFVTADTDKVVKAGTKKLVQRMEARDAKGKPLATTILGILSDRKLASGVHINQLGVIEYNDDEQFDGSWLLSAEIEIKAILITPHL